MSTSRSSELFPSGAELIDMLGVGGLIHVMDSLPCGGAVRVVSPGGGVRGSGIRQPGV